MLKFIAGFLLGVATTVTVVYWVAEEPSATQADLSDQSFAPDQMAEAKHALASSTDDKVTEATNTSTGADTVVEDSNLSASAQSASNVESATAKPQSTSAQQPGTGETSPARKSPANSTNDDYPPEIADMIENDVDKELQERYESDEREESWATYMKGQLTAYFAQKTALAQFYISLIDCRTQFMRSGMARMH